MTEPFQGTIISSSMDASAHDADRVGDRRIVMTVVGVRGVVRESTTGRGTDRSPVVKYILGFPQPWLAILRTLLIAHEFNRMH